MISLLKATVKSILPAPTWERLRARWWRYLRPLTVDYCPVMLPWFTCAVDGGNASRLHRLAFSFHWKDQPSTLTSVSVYTAAVLWPFRLLWDAGRLLRRYAAPISRVHGINRRTQYAGMLRYALRENIPPLYYYRYRLFDPRNARRAPSYIHADEMSVLFPMLQLDLPSNFPLRDKRAFFESGRRYGVEVVDVIAAFSDGAVEKWHAGNRDELPLCDVVLKPVDLACGRGFQLWRYDPDQKGWRRNGALLHDKQFIRHCCKASAVRPHILQVRIRNHPLLTPVAAEGLCTIRTVTYRRPSGAAGLLLACLRMPTGSAHVDNFEAGGIAAPIDLKTGILGDAVAKDPTRGPFQFHPDTTAPITGFQVPCFDEAKRLSLRAHAVYPWMPFVGWDVVITPSGPWLLEANPDWCVELAQIVSGEPLGETLYPEIYFEHLAAQRHARLAASETSEFAERQQIKGVV
ncbi:sugar-transfer associated ATP-grasp domain-containing protein [Candidatus Laterigemmans baculatus]|uniref:sugar-transfer associated ATP-grasp domain-containing protein n=1 Tax=Candidatus Laterigemmans baculatus TaxID=2770505 RepID=UPI0013DB96FF|nr:sugar-transfer associated ATP-grasp domain-containing protein [Candidatus Laterigemmans baculatus]